MRRGITGRTNRQHKRARGERLVSLQDRPVPGSGKIACAIEARIQVAPIGPVGARDLGWCSATTRPPASPATCRSF